MVQFMNGLPCFEVDATNHDTHTSFARCFDTACHYDYGPLSDCILIAYIAYLWSHTAFVYEQLSVFDFLHATRIIFTECNEKYGETRLIGRLEMLRDNMIRGAVINGDTLFEDKKLTDPEMGHDTPDFMLSMMYAFTSPHKRPLQDPMILLQEFVEANSLTLLPLA